MEYSNEVLKIVEGALKSDKTKVSNYTKLLVEKLKTNNETRLANSFLKILNASLSSMSQMSINDAMKVPIDQESRLPMADVIYPNQVTDINVILNNSANKQVAKFLDYYDNINKLISTGIRIPNSILLYGPPGCGKSKLATYLCMKTNLPLVTARLDGMISSYLGSTSKNIRAIFEYAHNMPCILFLDEFDAIAKVRDDNNELGELKRVVNSLLQNIDNLQNGSIIIAATNHQHLLDPAVWRRFGFKINIDKPENEARKKLIKLFLPNANFTDKEVDIISNMFSEYSGADIEEICNKTTIDSLLSDQNVNITLLFENIFDYINDINLDHNVDLTPKELNRGKATFLRNRNEKVFSYNQIAKILGVSKTYVADLLGEKEELKHEEQ